MVALRSPGRRPRRLARQPEGLPPLDRWPGQAVGLLNIVDTDPHIIRRIMLHGDRPQRVARLDDHRCVARRGASLRPQGEPDPEQRNGGDCRQQSPHRRKAAGTGCPPRFDPVTSGVHTFGSIPNGRSPVKTPNKGLRVEARSASMASALPPPRSGDEHELTEQLTERQNKILDYIRYVTKVRNYPPSVREIGEAVGLSSSSTVHNHLNH